MNNMASVSRRLSLDDIGSVIACGLQRRLGYLAILKLADEWVRVLILVKVTECVVDSSVCCFIGSDVEDQVLHRAMFLRHLPVLQKRVSANAQYNIGYQSYSPEWQYQESETWGQST